METPEAVLTSATRQVWNAGKPVGAKRALKPKQTWEIRFYLNRRRRRINSLTLTQCQGLHAFASNRRR